MVFIGDVSAEEWDEIDVLVDMAKRFINTPYIWGGDDPSGFDCSGMTIECLRAIGKYPLSGDDTANGLWNKFKDREIPNGRPGALAFWFNGEGKAVHVAVCIANKYCVTADGGGSKTLTLKDAIEQNAFIKIRKTDHRKTEPKFVYPFGQFVNPEKDDELDKEEDS